MPNSKQATPDPVDEDRVVGNPPNNNNNSANNMEPEVAAGVCQPPHAAPRRDENSISFRHFLQPHSDVVPNPAPTCRRNRGTQPGAVDLVDMAMALPDFVQDHLVVESLANVDHQNDPSHSGASSLDLNVLNEILPDFATSQSAPPQAGSSRNARRNIPENAPAGLENPHGASGTSAALPDFLSDGPMQCTDSNVVDNTIQGSSSSSRSSSRLISSASLTERSGSSFDSADALRSEIDRLRREIQERNRRITQLETEVLRLRSNVSTLETALRNSDQTTANSETRRMHIQRRPESTSGHLPGVKGGGSDASDNSAAFSSRNVNGGAAEVGEINAHVVREIAQSSEVLISQLLQNIARLQGLVPSDPQSDGNAEKSNTESKEKP